ncbi:hypothetical protein [Streptomyces sp. NPDC090025]
MWHHDDREHARTRRGHGGRRDPAGHAEATGPGGFTTHILKMVGA